VGRWKSEYMHVWDKPHEFENFKTSDNYLVSENFDETKPYFYFEIESTLSKAKVEKY
jgi:hypothetical protein